MKWMVIGVPYLESANGKTRLCADITVEEKTRILYYEVDDAYKDYLCIERSDAFLLNLIQFAMANDLNIKWEKEVTERLLYQLCNFFIPVIKKRFGHIFSQIELCGPTTNGELCKNIWGVGTGVSGGIDSFYSIIKNSCLRETSYNITHLVHVSISNNSKNEDSLRKTFEDGLNHARKISDKFDLPLIGIYCNESEFFFNEIINWGALRFVGMIYSLQKLFSVYYFSSGYAFDEISFGNGEKSFDSLHFDLFTLMTVSSKSLVFYSSGGEVNRKQKVRYIEKNSVVREELHVCNYSNINCSKCEKCMRTAMELDSDGVLESYSDVFNLSEVLKNKNRYIRKMLYRKSVFDRSILYDLNKLHKVPIGLKIQAFLIRPIYILWQRLKEIDFIMKIFYKFNIDYMLYGKDMAESIRYSKGIQARNDNK